MDVRIERMKAWTPGHYTQPAQPCGFRWRIGRLTEEERANVSVERLSGESIRCGEVSAWSVFDKLIVLRVTSERRT